MQIKRDRKYTSNLFAILQYIAKDKISASRNFKNKLDKKINIQDNTLAILDIFNQNKC